MSDLEVVADARDRARCGRSATTSSTRRPAQPDPDDDDHRGHDAPRDDPRRHGGGRPSRRRALRARSSAGGCASRSSSATCRSSPTTSSSAPSGPARSRSRRPTTTTTTQTGLRHGLPRRPILADDGTHRRHRARATTGSTATRRASAIVADLEARGDLVGRAAPRDGHRALPAQQRRHRAAAQDAVVHPDGAAGGTGARGDPTGRTRIVPERFEKTWEHWLTNIRDWNVSRQLWWGHRIPAWYCPDGHVTVSAEADGPDACAVCGRPAAELQQDPDIFDTWFSSGCGRSRRSAGRTTRPTCDATTRRRSWRPATTSSSSGSPG